MQRSENVVRIGRPGSCDDVMRTVTQSRCRQTRPKSAIFYHRLTTDLLYIFHKNY